MENVNAIAGRSGLGHLALLYVEDDESIREQLSQYLRRRVGRLYTADNGRAGLEAFRRYRPDIVVSDIRMPEMDGLEMAAAIKRDGGGAPVILTSAFSDTEYVLKAIDIGVDKYVLKPIKVDALVAAIQRSADALEARRDLQLAATVFHAVSESVLITDANHVVIAVNPAFERMTGYAKEEVVGHDIEGLNLDREAAAGPWTRLAAAGGGKEEIDVLRRDGSAFTGWVTADTVRSPDGRPQYIVFVLTDISDRKAAEDALRSVNEMLEARVRERTAALEEANRELESFSYSVSHDLTTPLRGIDGLARILEEDCADDMDEGCRDHLRRIRASTRRMGHLIEDLLALSRVSRVPISR
jgi:PAS domain S-box-containing protein